MTLNADNILFILLAINLMIMVLNIVFWVLVSLGDRKVKEREKQMYDKFNEVLNEANKKASDLIIGATDKANEMIKGTEVMVGDIRQEMRDSLASAKDRNIEVLEGYLKTMQLENKEFLGDLRDKLMVDARALIADMVEKSNKEMQQLVAEMKGQSGMVKQTLEERIEQEFESISSDITSYRQQRMSWIDKQIKQLLLRVFQLVWPQAVSLDEHEQLIMDSLEKAKKEGFFEAKEK